MTDLTTTVPIVRESVAALLRTRKIHDEKVKKGKVLPAQYQVGCVGSAFCVLESRYLITAHHTLNGAQPRNPKDKFFALIVPGNGDYAYHFPVVTFPVERSDVDIAVLEIGPCATEGARIPAIPVTFTPPPDGTQVATVGFPAPCIASAGVDAEGNYIGGEFFLKSHANTGIVAAQYAMGGKHCYEFSVGWHHGESGGPIVTISAAPAAFSLMQHYGNIQGPHGIVPGPHRGCALSTIQEELNTLGIAGV